MARALSQDEQVRYPWASRIVDFVPVGRLRHIGIYVSLGGLTMLVVSLIVVVVTSQNVRNGVHLEASTLGRVAADVSLLVMAAGFVIGLVGLVQAVVRNAKLPMLWSLMAMWELPLAMFLFHIKP